MRKIILLLFQLCFFSTLLFAQSGKITGTVTDSKTGEALIGVNVVVEGSVLGAATDLEGYYVILNVPPGKKTLKISYIGYTSQSVTNVSVNIDQTTVINVALSSQSIETQEVVVTAAVIPIVQQDVSASRANITAEEIANLPTVSVDRVISTQAGVKSTDGGFEVRGGNARETAFVVNGITLRDERDNNPYTAISVTSIENLQVTTGGFSAEYGDLRSGIINVVTKEGRRDKYTYSFIGRLKPASQKHFGISPHDYNSYWIRPFLDPKVAWTGTKNGAWNEFTQRQYKEFEGWNKISENLMRDDDPNNDLSPEAAQRLFLWQHRRQLDIEDSDYELDMSFGGPVPFVSKQLGGLRFFASFRQNRDMYIIPLSDDAYRDWSGQIKVTSDLNTGMKLMIDGLAGETTGTNNSRSGLGGVFRSASSIAGEMDRVSFIDTRIFAPDYWAPTRIKRNSIGAKFTHVLNPTTFYEAIISRFESRYSTNPASLRDTTLVRLFGENYWVDEAPFGFQPAPSDGIDGMRMGVGMSNSRDSSVIAVYTGKFDITSQVNKYNQVKAGLQVIYTRNQTNYAQFDQFLQSSNSQSKWDTKPVRGALYVQDKLEFEGMIANVGLRVDYFDPGGEWYVFDPYTSAFKAINIGGIDTLLDKSAVKKQLNVSPRVGISFPISINSKLYFNYGHTRSFPTPENLYLLRINSFDNSLARIANPNNPLEKTVQYELGYEHNLFDMFLLRVAGYYKDVTEQPVLVSYINRNRDVDYVISEPNSYRDIRGFELTLSKNRGSWFQGFVNYTYDVRTSGRFGYLQYYENPSKQREYERITDDSEQDKPIPRPYGRANLNFFTPEDLGPEIGGIYPLGDFRISLLGDWSSGQYFTWTGGGSIPGIIYNVQWKDYWNVDLRFSKGIDIADVLNLEFILDVTNVFNFKNMSNGYGYTDGDDYLSYMKSLHLPKNIGDEISGSYLNIPGDDVPGDYRRSGEFTPVVAVPNVAAIRASDVKSGAIYWDKTTNNYYEYNGQGWDTVDNGKLSKILKNKQYIDMPNQAYFTFLNPRQIYFALKLSLELF
ncbi:MAG: TonB-dependent receptor [Ignavibacteriae bacterium HGW-Ignavibacteriae-2]|jgi:hypothetical protein|nr:MAG: TonB-dependent receptor [Ignavibacteriae bacterium HGW-Ignavibacteriae-2]